MKKGFLQELYFGNVGSISQIRVSSDWKEKIGINLAAIEKFENSLSADQKKLWDNFLQTYEDHHGEDVFNTYCAGFTLGMRLMYEVMDSEIWNTKE